jgi:16S rRNA (adenine1518-N6/adenine1519-N6)-dimethyltransferase
VDLLTSTELRDLLAQQHVILSKRFGQNFLIDRASLAGIASHLPAGESIVFIEIGAGALALTGTLASRGKRVVAFEIDDRLRKVHDVLLVRDPLNARIDMRYEDGLNANWTSLVNPDETPILVGNLPYLRSTDTVLKLVQTGRICRAYLMFQREFADRLTARPGRHEYGSLSVVLQTFFAVERLMDLPPDVFFPRPDVHSALLGLDRHPAGLADEETTSFLRFVHGAFLHRRKKLADFFRRTGVPLTGDFAAVSELRPEALSPTDFVDLFHSVSPARNHT